MELTLENLPKAVDSLQETVNEIKLLLLKRANEPQQIEQDELLTVKDAAKLLSLSVPTIYGLISKGDLPVMKRSKRCYFSKMELMTYLKQGRRKTNLEISADAEKHISSKRK